jgi:broad specificity phosphatase PhoE
VKSQPANSELVRSTRVLLVRHGQTSYNHQGTIQGHIDIPLNDRGFEEASLLARRIGHRDRIDLLISSDLQRALQTASTIAEVISQEILKDRNFRELYLGNWEGRSWEQLEESYPGVRARYLQNWYLFSEHGGESRKDAGLRVNSALDQIIDAYRGKTIVIVTHGGPIRLISQRVLNCEKSRMLAEIGNCSITEISCRKDEYHLVRLNDCSHLEIS